ncbi:MAG: cytochrome c biogenesis protein CcdA [Leptolyngbyaceae cyanobacterium SM1_3_5]|nr:cytochrome c biogenesis protein CcdA [Leptolyngbyaceae cyanobacterium SM1_3_5]
MSLSFGLALLAGVLTVLSPCVLPILPIVLGRSLQSHHYGPVALMLGLSGGFALAGSLLGVTANWLTQFASALRSGAIVLLLAIGLLALFPQWSYRLLSYLPVSQPSARLGLAGEFWLGTQLGLLWTPCAGPVLGSSSYFSPAVSHQPASAFGLLLLYGMGAALPMLALAYGGRYLSRRLLSLRPYTERLQRIGGAIVVSTAIAILLGWDVQIQLWLAPLFPTPTL